MRFHLSLSLFLFLFFSSPTIAQIVNIEELRIKGTSDSVRWYGHLRGSANIIQVQDLNISLNFNGKIQYKREPDLFILLANTDLLRVGTKDGIRRNFIHFRYNRKLTEIWTAEVFSQAQTDVVRQLRDRILFGMGGRLRAFKSEDGRQRLYLGAAYMWEENHFLEEPHITNWHRISTYASITLRAGTRNMLVGTTYYQPILSEISNYRFSTDWLLKLGITSKLAFTVDFAWSIDQNLPPSAARSVYSWKNGLIWQF